MRLPRAILLLMATCIAYGCKDNLPKATEIVHMRVLGAKLEVVGDETRSTPKPGETVQVSLATVFPLQKQNTDNTQTLLIFCTAPSQFTGGSPVCQEFLDAAKSGSGADVRAALPLATGKLHCSDLPGPMLTFGGVSIQCISGDPVAMVRVADDFKARQKLMVGVVCERGQAFIDPSDPLLFGCDHDSGETLRLNELIAIEKRASDENHNPSADDVGVALESLSKDTWGPIDPSLMPMEDSCGPAVTLPQRNPLAEDDAGVPAGPIKSALPPVDYLSHTMTLSYDAKAREMVNGQPENLELSVYTTGGKLERRFTLFGPNDKVVNGQLQSDLTWDPPPVDELPNKAKDGKLIRFFVTVRDHRGGFAMTSRAVCIKVPQN